MKSSIKNKLVSFFGVILVVGLAISAFVSNRLCQSIIEANAIECFDGTVRAEAEKLNLILNEKIKMITNTSKIPLLGRQEVEIEQKLMVASLQEFRGLASDAGNIASTLEEYVLSL